MLPKVRAFEAEDVSAVAAMLKNVPDGWSEAALTESLSNDSIKSFVLEKQGQTAAFASFLVADDAELVFVVTDMARLREGCAEQLLCETLDILNMSCVLEVRESNTAAIKLYEKIGFEKIGIRKNFYSNPKENAVIYKKEQ